MEIFIKEFRTTNELLLKEQSNLLSELEIKVNEFSKVMGNVLVLKNEVKGVTTRGGKMTSSKEINETGINKNKPPRFEQDVQKKSHDDGVENKSSMLEKQKDAEDLAAYHLSRFENPHMEVLTEREIADKLSDEHLMVLKSKFNNDEPCASVTAKKVYESGFYWPSIFKDANERKTISVGHNPKDWSEKLDDALWAFKIAYKTPTGCTPFRLVYGKPCHLPVESEHKAHRALKQCNMDLMLASESHLMHLNELAKLRDGAYENTRIHKERTKKWHDSRLHDDKDFRVGDKVLLYNSCLKMYPRKLKSKWSGQNSVKMVYPYGDVEIIDKNGFDFKVNGQRLKKYYKGDIDKEDDEVIEFEDSVT
ncbi:reverse transcriptase domain-containing protein [Tanacetum coccineum]